MTKNDYQFLADYYRDFGREPQWKRFNHCQAWITDNEYYDETTGTYFGMVKSYNTIVAIIDYSRHRFVRLGKWSQTTSKQSTQIHNQLYREYEDIQL